MMSRLAALTFLVLCIIPAITRATSLGHSTSSRSRAIAKSKYTEPHSLGDSYAFDPRDGWQNFNASNLQYKYRRESTKNDKKKTSAKKPNLSLKEAALGAVSKVLEVVGMKGFGKPQRVTVTWYTGHDLLNPSCWANTNWAPTDESFVCALTLQGWQDKPKCFKFIELCNTPKKCIFVRVVDSCAGCAAGSRHVDLTKKSFGALADPDQGLLEMQSRPASDPDEWFEDLWGPRAN